MRIEFADRRLSVIEAGSGDIRLPVGAIAMARRRLAVLRAASDDRALTNWKSLQYERLDGDRRGQRAIRVTDRYRLIFELDEDTDPQTARILMIEGMQ